ncbi:helix-turn-helix domain-containing protein [Cesiribacter andamanensis]|uniref:DNA binding domain, excisionase family n=1 Tax=Cesiribacter andamanensis AMV16 TaxID=1279009 RepID=M7NYD6_9BACT|nr:helix-turn-helix domain-containing protein [Cesiribacter andamanensis]EMR03394.1 DNA binding domain, excisionase family [Cesiribacter andamanensis AMV16]
MSNPFEHILKRLDQLEILIKESQVNNITNAPEEEIITVEGASQFLHLAVPTIYGLVNRRAIPFMKKGKRLFFSKKELTAWLKSGSRRTLIELTQDAPFFSAKALMK